MDLQIECPTVPQTYFYICERARRLKTYGGLAITPVEFLPIAWTFNIILADKCGLPLIVRCHNKYSH